MDVVELREQLVHSNVTFATEIIDHQETDTAALNKVIDAIANILDVGYKPSEYITVSFIPPVVLILQLIEMTLSSVGNIASVFTNMQMKIDPFFFLQQYVPHIDWMKFKSAMDIKDIEDSVKTSIDNAGMDGGQPGGQQ